MIEVSGGSTSQRRKPRQPPHWRPQPRPSLSGVPRLGWPPRSARAKTTRARTETGALSLPPKPISSFFRFTCGRKDLRVRTGIDAFEVIEYGNSHDIAFVDRPAPRWPTQGLSLRRSHLPVRGTRTAGQSDSARDCCQGMHPDLRQERRGRDSHPQMSSKITTCRTYPGQQPP